MLITEPLLYLILVNNVPVTHGKIVDVTANTEHKAVVLQSKWPKTNRDKQCDQDLFSHSLTDIWVLIIGRHYNSQIDL
jgi:hypothetical protein